MTTYLVPRASNRLRHKRVRVRYPLWNKWLHDLHEIIDDFEVVVVTTDRCNAHLPIGQFVVCLADEHAMKFILIVHYCPAGVLSKVLP